MELAGQGNRGYAMAALLVGLSVMAVLMSMVLPVWTTMAKREKEAELIFRGNQYARAVGLFQRKFANTPPPTIDVLVEQRFLRKKYKDPITNDDFQPLYANRAMTPGGPGGQPQPGQPQQRGTPAPPGGPLLQPGFGATGATAAGGIIGVTSKSKDTSLRVFNGRTRYNEWAFVHVQTSQRPGQPGPGGAPGAQGAPNQRQGQPSPLACRRDRLRLNDRACPCNHQDSDRTGRPFLAARHLRRPQVRRSPFLVSHSRARRRVLQVSDDRVVHRAANLLDPFVIVTRRMHAIRQHHDV